MKSIVYKRVSPILFDDTNLDRMFMVLFERCVKLGSTSKPRKKKDFDPIQGSLNLEMTLIPKLSTSENFRNFDNETGREILTQWIRTSIAQFSTEGKTGKGSQLDYLKLLSLAVYRSGLPKMENRSSNRGIDDTFYKILHEYVGSLPGCDNPEREIHNQICSTSLAKGIDFNPQFQPWNSPMYNEREQVDINSLLQLRLLEHFPGIKADDSQKIREQRLQELLMPKNEPLVRLAEDFFNITRWFGQRSGAELFEMYKSVFAIRLFQLPIYISRELLASKHKIQAKPIAMFFDFTEDSKSDSWKLANESLLMDIASANLLTHEMVSLRESEEFIKKNNSTLNEFSALNKKEQLYYLYEFMESSVAQDKAYESIQELKTHFENMGEEGSTSLEIIDGAVSRANNAFDALIHLILLDVGQRGAKSLRKWFYSVGGLEEQKNIRSISILTGQQKRTTSWTYVMSDSVLNTLLELCFIDKKGNDKQRMELELSEVLNLLKTNYGILINEPPIGKNSPEFQHAAAQNFIAFKKRLRQLGWFEGLSDDFDAQYIKRIG